jgi:diguanylate cyclase (GGDEF)-like protein
VTPLLQHVKAITHPRDQALVDIAMANSLCELVDKRRRRIVLRLYRIVSIDSRYRIHLTAWTYGGDLMCEEIECDSAAAPPRMIQALDNGVITSGVGPDDQGANLHFTWLPVSRDKELLACIELGLVKPLSPGQLMLIDGMRGLYANYLSLLHYSQVDTLTQLLNRKTFDESLDRLLAHAGAKTAKQPSSERRSHSDDHLDWLGVIDIDHFKRVNDTYGHMFGDEVLILVADVMRKVFRRKDKLFRFGGEEFVVLLRDTTEKNALGAFERFRRSVENRNFPQLGNVTVSVGITVVRRSDTPTMLLGRADEALYYGKKNGRNQCRFYEQLAAAGQVATTTVLHTEADLF